MSKYDYDVPPVGLYLQADPVGMRYKPISGDTSYAYAALDPAGNVDFWGLCLWYGQVDISIASKGRVAGGGLLGHFTSECYKGRRVEVGVAGVLIGAEIAPKIFSKSNTVASLTMITAGAPNADDFSGSIVYFSLTYTTAWGPGLGYLELGKAEATGPFAINLGWSGGFDALGGWSFPVWKKESCCQGGGQ